MSESKDDGMTPEQRTAWLRERVSGVVWPETDFALY